MAKTAMQVLEKVVTQLFDEIREQASTARENGSLPYRAEKGRILGHIRLGEGVLTVRRNMIHGIIAPEEFPFSKWDVIVGATIEIEQLTPHYVWAASLWYTNLHSRSEYRWYDVAYCTHVLSSSPRDLEPFALTEHDEADKAATIGNHPIGLAYDPKPIDDDDVTDFISRWAGLLAQASAGELRCPNLPLEHRLPMAIRRW